jgi:hypothetical protein
MKAVAASLEEQNFLLSSLSPGPAQKQLALGVVLLLLIRVALTAGPLSTAIETDRRLPPLYVAAMFVTDSLTAVLLFAQFSILRTPALWRSRADISSRRSSWSHGR